MGGQNPQGFQGHRRYRITAQGIRRNPAPVKSGKMKISFGTDVEKKNRRANPAVRDAMAQLADASAEFQTAVQHSQVILEAGTNATAFFAMRLPALPQPREKARAPRAGPT